MKVKYLRIDLTQEVKVLYSEVLRILDKGTGSTHKCNDFSMIMNWKDCCCKDSHCCHRHLLFEEINDPKIHTELQKTT